MTIIVINSNNSNLSFPSYFDFFCFLLLSSSFSSSQIHFHPIVVTPNSSYIIFLLTHVHDSRTLFQVSYCCSTYTNAIIVIIIIIINAFDETPGEAITHTVKHTHGTKNFSMILTLLHCSKLPASRAHNISPQKQQIFGSQIWDTLILNTLELYLHFMYFILAGISPSDFWLYSSLKPDFRNFNSSHNCQSTKKPDEEASASKHHLNWNLDYIVHSSSTFAFLFCIRFICVLYGTTRLLLVVLLAFPLCSSCSFLTRGSSHLLSRSPPD